MPTDYYTNPLMGQIHLSDVWPDILKLMLAHM